MSDPDVRELFLQAIAAQRFGGDARKGSNVCLGWQGMDSLLSRSIGFATRTT